MWPRPGRIFAASRGHTFAQLATAIDDGFARWDRSHLHEFDLGGGHRVGEPDPEEGWDEGVLDDRVIRLDRLVEGQQFVYVFDLGDCWTHLCTVTADTIDPLEAVGIEPDQPTPYWGWGLIPDQYGRRWDGDDGESPMPPDPELADLPALQPLWGGATRRDRH
ncbi:IS1096 element passenger TnpR family protein [Nocardia gipuzkoensis]|uniref:IS1096 element passenger TnpR family protein n=1 Tax=Nocardia gipuzkoensis TaxID=2749991 RepID=UPI00237DC328|nr:hypothetical protein [Nocardia gipuzkoensis]MDE1672024.1 hypothetical protein [Nocardia gipuzkoensis]